MRARDSEVGRPLCLVLQSAPDPRTPLLARLLEGKTLHPGHSEDGAVALPLLKEY